MALREDTSIAGADKRTKMMDIHKASQDKIRALLTDDQKTKFDALQAEMRERRENHRWRRRASAACLRHRRHSSNAFDNTTECRRGRREQLSFGLLAWLALLQAPVRLQ